MKRILTLTAVIVATSLFAFSALAIDDTYTFGSKKGQKILTSEDKAEARVATFGTIISDIKNEQLKTNQLLEELIRVEKAQLIYLRKQVGEDSSKPAAPAQ